MAQRRKEASQSIELSRNIRDKSRNEQQKSVLLMELALTKYQKQCDRLREDSERAIERSKALAKQSHRLSAQNDQKRKDV